MSDYQLQEERETWDLIAQRSADALKGMLYVATRSVLTGHLSDIVAVGHDIGLAREYAQARADSHYSNSVWLTTGNPTSRYSSVLETFPAARA